MQNQEIKRDEVNLQESSKLIPIKNNNLSNKDNNSSDLVPINLENIKEEEKEKEIIITDLKEVRNLEIIPKRTTVDLSGLDINFLELDNLKKIEGTLILPTNLGTLRLNSLTFS